MLVATVLALSSATLHATWNLLLKTSGEGDRDLTSWGQFLMGGVLVVPVLFVIGWPVGAAYPWLAASAVVHLAYVAGLVKAYGAGDFSVAYPLARGGGALTAALGGVALLGDHQRSLGWLAIAVVVLGMLSLIGRSPSRPTVAWALFTALAIGTYTLIDSHGSRLSDSGVSYGFATMPFIATALSVVGVARGRGPALLTVFPGQWRRYTVGGACIAAAYTLVLVAVRSAPVGYVTMLRESSVVLGGLAGWLFLHESLGRRRLGSSLVILSGLLLLVVVNA